MGANQYTPSTEQVKEDFATRMAPYADSTRRVQFDRWLSQVRAEAKEEALNEAATYAVEWVGVVGDGQLVDLKTETEHNDTAEWLRARAEQIREGT